MSHDSHDEHEEHDHDHDSHGSHADHDSHDYYHEEEHGNGHGGHEMHHDEEEDEPEKIEPAGFLNDLRECDENLPIDLSEFFPISKATAVSHNRHNIWTDIKKGIGNPLNLSTPLKLIRVGNPTKRFYDLYDGKAFSPSLLDTFSRKATSPRFATIVICDPIAIPDFSVDVRMGEEIAKTFTHPDIFFVPKPWTIRTQRFLGRHKKLILKQTGYVVLASTIVVLVFSGIAEHVKTLTANAYGDLLILREERDPKVISEKIHSISEAFSMSEMLFRPIGWMSEQGIVANSTVENANHAIRWGYFLSQAMNGFDDLRNQIITGMKTGSGEAVPYADLRMITDTESPITDILVKNDASVRRIAFNLHNASLEYANVTDAGDAKKTETVKTVSRALDVVSNALDFTLAHKEEVFKLLGHTAPKHYLLINQNRDELRANGGFPGSVIDITLYKWRVEKFERKDIYFYDWRLFPYGETPPAGIDKITNVFGMRDANYYYDFDKTLATMSRMYEKAGGDSLDGIIAINQGVVIDLLRLTGPINAPGILEEVNAENFSLLMSVLVEWQIGRQTSAKDILFTFMEEFAKKLQKANMGDILNTVQKHVEWGEVLVALRDKDLSDFVHTYVPEDRYKNRTDNFVYPVFTSLGANKSDRYMERKFTINSKTLSGCTALNHFELLSKSTFTTAERERIRQMLYKYGIDPKDHEHELFVQGNGTNKQFVRLVVPKGAKLASSASVPLELDDTESDADVISFMIETKTMENSSLSFDYTTTPSSCDPKPYFIAQPGLQHYSVDVR